MQDKENITAFIKAHKDLITKMVKEAAHFNKLIVGYPIPDKPELMSDDRANFRADFMQEEINEFREANKNQDLDGAVDAIIDLMYVAAGAMNEMGVLTQPCWDEVHKANMKKIRGSITKRPGSKGFDAVKPKSWKAPSHADYLTITSDDVKLLLAMKKYKPETPDISLNVCFDENTIFTSLSPKDKKLLTAIHNGEAKVVPIQKHEQKLDKPLLSIVPAPKYKINTFDEKIIVLGYAGHGKDTVCELLANKYGLDFTSSSQFCAQQVVFPALKDKYGYKSIEECYKDRSNHRVEWFDLITAYNTPDKTKLGRKLFQSNDIYCGIRNAREFHALKNSGIFQWAIWVDASERGIPVEDKSSCNVEPWMADFILDNNGSIEDLEYNLDQLIINIFDLKQEGD